jgi:hypothetical protein
MALYCSSVSATSSDPRFSCHWAMRLMPTIGAVIPGVARHHASVTWELVAPISSATASTTRAASRALVKTGSRNSRLALRGLPVTAPSARVYRPVIRPCARGL